jgi:opacity protein-like surface antigen
MFRRSLDAALGTIVLAAFSVSCANALDLGGHDREGVTLGLSGGVGWSSYTFDLAAEEVTTDAEAALSGGLSLGWARDDRWLVSLSFAGWRKEFDQETTPITVRNFHVLADVTWFPGGEGIWIRAGAGLANVDFTVRPGGDRIAVQGNGWSAVLGAGWEYRATEMVAVGLGYELRTLDLGEFDALGETSGHTHTVALTLRYYGI